MLESAVHCMNYESNYEFWNNPSLAGFYKFPSFAEGFLEVVSLLFKEVSIVVYLLLSRIMVLDVIMMMLFVEWK